MVKTNLMEPPEPNKNLKANNSQKEPLYQEKTFYSNYPLLVEEIDFKRNRLDAIDLNLNPESTQDIWWKCEAGHSWFISIFIRIKYKATCPMCYGTQLEKECANKLNEIFMMYKITFRAQSRFCVNEREVGIFDFEIYGFDNSTLIEPDGQHHFKYIHFSDGCKTLEEIQAKDREKDQFCTETGKNLLRISHSEINNIGSHLMEFFIKILVAQRNKNTVMLYKGNEYVSLVKELETHCEHTDKVEKIEKRNHPYQIKGRNIINIGKNNLTNKDIHERHSKIFCKFIKGKCFTVVDGRNVIVWLANECNLWKKEPKSILSELIINMNKILTKGRKDINEHEKVLSDELIFLYQNIDESKLNDITWIENIVKYVIIELRDNNREKMMNKTRGEISFPPCHVLILETAETRKRIPEDNWNIELPVSYISLNELDKKKQEIWETFFNQLTLGNENMASRLMNICGSLLLGHGSNKSLILIEGDDESGKDVLFDAIEATMGDFAVKENKKQFISKSTAIVKVLNTESFERARYLRISNLEQKDKVNSEYIDNIIKGEEITIKDMARNIISYLPLYPLILTSEPEIILNNILTRKTYNFILEAKFITNPKPKASNQFKLNRRLVEGIKNDTGMLQVVLCWLVIGLQRFIKDGNKIFMNKERIKRIKISKIRSDVKMLHLFIEEECRTLWQDEKLIILKRLKKEELDKDRLRKKMLEEWLRFREKRDKERERLKENCEYKYKIGVGTLHSAYLRFADNRGEEGMSERDFEEWIGHRIVDINNCRCYVDIALKDDDSSDEE